MPDPKRGAGSNPSPGTAPRFEAAGARIRTWELLREQILSLPPLAARPPRLSAATVGRVISSSFRSRVPGPPRFPGRSRGRPALAEADPWVERRRPGLRPGACGADGTGPVAPAGRRGTFGPDAPIGAASARSCPQSSSGNTLGSTGPSTPRAIGRCSASRFAGRAPRSGRRGGATRRALPSPRGRRGPRSSRRRCAPSGRCDVPCVRRISRLGLLTYRTVDSRARDDRHAVAAVLPVRRRGDRPDAARDRARSDRVGPGRAVSGGAAGWEHCGGGGEPQGSGRRCRGGQRGRNGRGRRGAWLG